MQKDKTEFSPNSGSFEPFFKKVNPFISNFWINVEGNKQAAIRKMRGMG